jgi:hypothetical protein
MSAPDMPEMGIAGIKKNAKAKRRDSDSGSGLYGGLNIGIRAMDADIYIIVTQPNKITRVKKMSVIL